MIINKSNSRPFQVGKNAFNPNRMSMLNNGVPVLQREVYQMTDVSSEAEKVVCQIETCDDGVV